MKQPNSIQFILGTKGVIPSVNSIYKAKMIYKYGKPIPTLYKDSTAVKVTEEINEQLRMIDFKNEAPWIFKKDAVFNLTIQFIFKQSFFKRDLDNLMKVVQDAIFRYFGINDSRVIELHTYKSILPNAAEEKICVSLSQSNSEIRFDKMEELPVPERIFLGGTCAGSTWRDELIPELDKRGYSYFNPVVPDWTAEMQLIESKEKEEYCDSHLYVLTPEMKGLFSVAEIINSAWQAANLGTGSMIFGILGKEEDWGTSMWTSLLAIKDMVLGIGRGTKRIVACEIQSPLDLLQYYGEPKKKRKKKIEGN